MTKEAFDVIIIGAGPAGLRCAEILGDSHLSVLLVEKNAVIGPKVCAGGLTGKDIAYLNLPSELIEYRYNKVKLHVNGITSYISSSEDFAFTIDREQFGQWQLQKLQQYDNIKVRTSARVAQITNEDIEIDGKRIAYRYLVGADGSHSIVRKFLGKAPSHQNIGIHYIIPTDAYQEFELYFEPKLFSAWYAWIFPHKGYVSIGCGCDPRHLSGDKLKQNFHHWLKKHHIDLRNATYQAAPMNSEYIGLQFGSCYLTGDAAGLLSYFTGEGIYQALVSGETVARLILDPTYKSDRMPLIEHKHQRHEQLIQMLLKAGWAKSLMFMTGQQLFKIPKYREKAINLFG